MRITDANCRGDPVSVLAPLVLRAPAGGNLLSRRNWTFAANGKPFRDLLPPQEITYFGVPFFHVPLPDRGIDIGNKHWAHRIGWGDPHLLQIQDSTHYWHDPGGKTLHLLFRAAAHRANIAAVARMTEDAAGTLAIVPENTPGGAPVLFVPLPGGNLRFDVFYDTPSRLYWLVSNQVTDSMTRADKLPRQHAMLPCEDSRRLQLHFSKNLVDWCFAGLVTDDPSGVEGLHSPSTAVCGNDLGILACGGSRELGPRKDAAIMFAWIPNFRALAY